MQTIKTVETQVPFLKESFFTTTFKGRRKSSVTNILRKQQQSLLNQQHQQQQQCILEHQHENGQGQCTPQHQRRVRSTSIPLCKAAECEGADGDRKEGQKERKDQRPTEAAQWRQGEQGVSGSEPVAVSASPFLIPAAQEPGEATSLAQLPSSGVGRKQGTGSSEHTLTSREAVLAASQEAAQHAQPRPQQHGLLAKGVRLLRNMGNQEAKQKKGGGGSSGAAGDVSCEGDADDREVDKKSKKSHNKSSKGGENGAKKKSKSESKASVFSGMKIRKSLSRAKGLSKEDMLEDGRLEHFSKMGIKPAADACLSADEMDMLSDAEGDLSRLTADSRQSAADELNRKMSSGSDGDLYSFHSAAAENEDLLSDIQQAMRDQCVAGDGLLVAGRLAKESPTEEPKAPGKVVPCQLFNLEKDVLPPPVANKHVPHEAVEERKKLENENHEMPMSRNSSGPESPSESGPPSSAPDTERSSVSLFPKTNSTYSFPDTNTTTTSYESAEEPQDDLESPVLVPPQIQNMSVPLVLLDPVVAGAAGPMGTHKSVSSMDLSTQGEMEEDTGRRDFLSLKRRKSSLSISQLTTDPYTPQSRRTSSSSPSTVKLYPPIHPSYVKTTTRQLTSPVGSPITSPHVPRKTNAGAAPVESNGGAGFRKHKQRSSSIGGAIGVSADWLTEQESPEKSSSGGTYWTLGSRRAHHARQAPSDTSPYLDVFSGE